MAKKKAGEVEKMRPYKRKFFRMVVIAIKIKKEEEYPGKVPERSKETVFLICAGYRHLFTPEPAENTQSFTNYPQFVILNQIPLLSVFSISRPAYAVY